VANPHYHKAEMLSSYQAGVCELLRGDGAKAESAGVLLALGDQPHIPTAVLALIVQQAQQTPDQIVIPSHQMRRGHPIYLPRSLWHALLALSMEESLRDLLTRYAESIIYVNVETDAIRWDMDTPADYAARLKQG
jgi:molybdenum cofactor cytidylyltransferase